MCDASDFAVGAVLGQRRDKKLRAVYYASRTLDEFRQYLVGSQVIVHTDHTAIKYLMQKEDAKPRLLVADHLFRIRVEDDVPIDYFLPTENVYQTDSSFVGNVCLISEEPSIDTSDATSIDTPDDQGQDTLPITLTIDIKVKPVELKGYTRNFFFREVRRYHWDEPYVYKHGSDGIYRRCVASTEIPDILLQCHVSDYAGHFETFKTVSKILQAGFWWPTMFCDAHAFKAQCDKYQRRGKISKIHEMEHISILEVVVFNCWGDILHGSFPFLIREQIYPNCCRLCVTMGRSSSFRNK
ncbi:unnamed protein product [Brassica oleracea]